MEDRIQLPFNFDANRMATEVAELAEHHVDWVNHFVARNYDGNWSAIPLRANRGAEHPAMMLYPDPTSDDYVDTPFLTQSPYLREVLAVFKTTLYSTRLMRLTSGSRIKEHRDYGLTPESGTVRLHIPVVTNPQVNFQLNGKRVIMEAGTCWYLRLTDVHSVSNDGPDRVHLVIDVAVNDWLMEILAAGGTLHCS